MIEYDVCLEILKMMKRYNFLEPHIAIYLNEDEPLGMAVALRWGYVDEKSFSGETVNDALHKCAVFVADLCAERIKYGFQP